MNPVDWQQNAYLHKQAKYQRNGEEAEKRQLLKAKKTMTQAIFEQMIQDLDGQHPQKCQISWFRQV